MNYVLIITAAFSLAACAGVDQAALTRDLPPACYAVAAATFDPERRPSAGGQPITDQSAARILSAASRAINSGNARLADLGDLERERVENGCLAVRVPE